MATESCPSLSAPARLRRLQENEALLKAAGIGDVEAARKALDRGADTECFSKARAREPCCWSLPSALLRRSALTRATAVGAACGCAQDDGGHNHTPLHCATIKGHEGVVQLLLDKGASVEAKNNVRQFAPCCRYAASRRVHRAATLAKKLRRTTVAVDASLRALSVLAPLAYASPNRGALTHASCHGNRRGRSWATCHCTWHQCSTTSPLRNCLLTRARRRRRRTTCVAQCALRCRCAPHASRLHRAFMRLRLPATAALYTPRPRLSTPARLRHVQDGYTPLDLVMRYDMCAILEFAPPAARRTAPGAFMRPDGLRRARPRGVLRRGVAQRGAGRRQCCGVRGCLARWLWQLISSACPQPTRGRRRRTRRC